MKVNTHKALVATCGTAAAVALIGALSLIAARPAAATSQFAKDTGKSCGDCHTSVKGGGPLTPFGEKFKANGNKLPN